MLTRSQESTSIVNEVYLKALKITEEHLSPDSMLCRVYEVVEELPPVKRILPVLKCLERLNSSMIDDDVFKTLQRLLISIVNLKFDKASAGRTTPYTEEVFYFLGLVIPLSPQLASRNQTSLSKIVECALNHLLFLAIQKRPDEISLNILAMIMQQVEMENSCQRLLDSICLLIDPETVVLKPENAYFGYLTKQNKTVRHSAVLILWKLIGYLMENVQQHSVFTVPLNSFLNALKLTYGTNNVVLEKFCANKLLVLMKLGSSDPDLQSMFSQICQQLNFEDDHPVILNARQALVSSIETESKEKAAQQLHSLCLDATQLLKDVHKLRQFNEFLSSPELGLPLPVEFAIGSLFRHPLVVGKKVSSDVVKEIELCQKLCSSLLKCRTQLSSRTVFDDATREQQPYSFASKSTLKRKATVIVGDDYVDSDDEIIKPLKTSSKKRPSTPPILIILDETIQSPELIELDRPLLVEDQQQPERIATEIEPSSSTEIIEEVAEITEVIQARAPKRTRRVSQIDYAQVLVSDIQFQEQTSENEDDDVERDHDCLNLIRTADQILVTRMASRSDEPSRTVNDDSLIRLFTDEGTSKTLSKSAEEPENLADLF